MKENKSDIVEFFTAVGIALVISIVFYIFTKQNVFTAVVSGMALMKAIQSSNKLI